MMYAPVVRIVLRYVVGALVGTQVADTLASDKDVVDVLAAGLAVACGVTTEYWYRHAKKHNGET